MLLLLVNILAVVVARERAESLGAPPAIRLFHPKFPPFNSTAQQTETVPVTSSTAQETEKASVHQQRKIFHQLSIPYELQNNDTVQLSTSDSPTTARTTSTVYDHQSSTPTEHRSLEELLKLARSKYLRFNSSLTLTTQTTVKQRKPKSRVNEEYRRKLIIGTNKQRDGLLHAVVGSSRMTPSGSEVEAGSISQMDKRTNESDTIEITKSAQVQEAQDLGTNSTLSARKYVSEIDEEDTEVPDTVFTTQITITSDPPSMERLPTDQDDTDHTTQATASDGFSSVTSNTSTQDSISPETSPMNKRMNQMTDSFQLMTSDEAQSVIDRHQGRSLMHQPGHLAVNIQNIFDESKEINDKYANRFITEVTLQTNEKLSLLPKENHSKEILAFESETENVDNDTNTEGSADDWMEIHDGQYHEIDPGQYYENNPGQYSEINPGQYYEEHPGQYFETNPGQYHEVNPGQEVQLDVEFNPEEETKTYNVHKKTGDYIIGEVGKININNGQTLEGVRYTAVDGMVDQAQIAEILKRYFGAETA